MLGITTKAQSKATEKLSSGYRINRAADDAAGLAISEKMRKQIRGLTQASANAQDGISAVQTAEGALTEVHDMIQRMNELATKSANGTNSQEERDYIQAEVDQLVSEIDRVAETTKFNDLYLLKGGDEKAKVTYTIPATEAQEAVDFSVAYKNAGSELEVDANYGDTDTTNTDAYNYYKAGESTALTAEELKGLVEISVDSDGNESVKLKEGVVLYKAAATAAGTADAQTSDQVVHDSETNFAVSIKAQGALYAAAWDSDNPTNQASTAIEASDLSNYFDADGHVISDLYAADGTDAIGAETIADYVTITLAKEAVEAAPATTGEKEVSAMKLSLHVGAESSSTNKISVTIKKMDSATIGVKGLDVSSEDAATAAIDQLNSALRIVSEQRADLGAVQNRLEHTISNLDNVVENTTAAESQIRDTDMATQMVLYSNNNILAQAGQAMLAQSNQANQGVLSLLS